MTSYHHHSNGQKWNSARLKLILDLVLCAAHIQCNNREARTGCQSTLRNCSPPYSPLFISQHLLASTMLPGVNLTASVPQECSPCTAILVHCWLSSTMWPLYGLQLSAFFPRAAIQVLGAQGSDRLLDSLQLFFFCGFSSGKQTVLGKVTFKSNALQYWVTALL